MSVQPPLALAVVAPPQCNSIIENVRALAEFKDIPVFPALLVQRGRGLLGWNAYYECRVYDQGWRNSLHSYGKNEIHELEKI